MNDIKIIIAKQKEINDLSELYLNALIEIDKLRDNNNLLKLKLDDKNEAEDELIDNDNYNYNCIGCKRPSKGYPDDGVIDCSHADMGCTENLYGRWTCEGCYGKKIIKREGW